MIEFFKSQMDYIYFLNGMAFFAVAAVCFLLIKTKDRHMRWFWLGFFTLFQGIYESLNLLSLSFAHNEILNIARSVVFICSFLLLFEFGRASLMQLKQVKIPVWFYLFFFIILGVAWRLGGMAGFQRAASYCLGVFGGLFVAFVFFLGFLTLEEYLKPWRLIASIVFALFALSYGVTLPGDSFIPSAATQESFLYALGFPVQLFRGILAALSAIILWIYWYLTQIQDEASWNMRLNKKKKYLSWIASLLFVSFVAGWFIVNLVGVMNNDQEIEKFFVRADTAAAAIDYRHVRQLSASSVDVTKPAYMRLREQLAATKKANPDFRFVYLMIMRNGEVLILADSEPVNSASYSPPGQAYTEAPQGLKENFTSRAAFFIGPYRDRWGKWVSAYSPVKDIETDRNVALVGMDIDADVWQRLLFSRRALGILIVIGSFLVLIAVFVIIQLDKVTAEKVKDSESFLNMLINGMPIPVYYKDIGGNFLGCNTAFEEFLGKQKKNIIGKKVNDIFPEDLAKRLNALDQILLRTHGVQTHEATLPGTNMKLKDVIFSKATYGPPGGQAQGIVGMMIDITERKKAEEKYKTLMESLDVGVARLTLGPQAAFIHANEAMVKMFGYFSVGELLKVPVLDFHGNSEEWRALEAEIYEKGFIKNKELRLRRKDGSIFYASATAKASYDEKGHIQWIDGIIEDISERKKMEQALSQSEQRYRLLAENTGDVIWTMDEKGKITYVSPAVMTQRGFKPEEIVESTLEEALAPSSVPAARKAFQEALRCVKEGKPVETIRLELELYRKDRSTIWCDFTCNALFNPMGEFVGFMGVAREIKNNKNPR